MTTPRRPLVGIESPYAGSITMHLEYLTAAIRDSLQLGEAPFASHGLYTRFLDDSIQEERNLGMECGRAWLSVADKVAFYYDLGISPGMRDAIVYCCQRGLRVEFRSLEKWKTGVFKP